jgi:hypothetical protein
MNRSLEEQFKLTSNMIVLFTHSFFTDDVQNKSSNLIFFNSKFPVLPQKKIVIVICTESVTLYKLKVNWERTFVEINMYKNSHNSKSILIPLQGASLLN